MLKRKPIDIAGLPQKGDGFFIADQQHDGLEIRNVSITTSSFVRLGMKGSIFNNCHLTQSHFEDSYFRKANFQNVDFTGSIFRYCNFDKAIFKSCNFRYCSFFFCKLPRDEIISCLPQEPNLRRDLARNIRANYLMLGDKKSADVFLNKEITACEEELKSIFLSKTQYYKENYNFFEQISSGLKFLGSKISGMLWGYGHRIGRLLLSYVVVTFFCSLLTYLFQTKFLEPGQPTTRVLQFWESIYLAFAETVSISGSTLIPAETMGSVMQLFERFWGMFFLALLAATFYRRISR